MRLLLSIFVVFSLAMLTACSTPNDTRYLDSRLAADLAIPPDLTTPKVDKLFVLPSNIRGDDDSLEAKHKIPVLAKVDSMRLEGNVNFQWLLVESPVDDLYLQIKEFWASEGYPIILDEPVIGIMQTDWVNRDGLVSKQQTFFDRLVGRNLQAEFLEQFKTRIARDDEANLVRVFVSHRSSEYEEKDDGEYAGRPLHKRVGLPGGGWIARPPNAELEVEILSRLMVYLGLSKAGAEERVENIKLFAPRATLEEDYEKSETYLLVQEPYVRTWHMTLHQLDRMKVAVVESDISRGFTDKGEILVNTGKDVEVKKSVFSNETEIRQKQLNFVLSEQTLKTTRIDLQSLDGKPDNSAEALELLNRLYNYIR
jgi:outer membrane protein assembly factor BamC